MHHVETLGRVLLVRLVVDEAGEVRLLAQELHHEELVALVPREREQEGVKLLKPLLRRRLALDVATLNLNSPASLEKLR